MTRSNSEIVADLESFAPVDDEWLRLDDLLGELWSGGSPANAIETLLGIFERFPESDGNGVFWTIIHGLEDIGGYEVTLIDSIRREPSFCGLIMVNRLINGGCDAVGNESLITLLTSVGNDESVATALRDRAHRFVAYQQDKAT